MTPRFLRFYEDQGLLQPMRRGTRRLYNDVQQSRVAAIVRARLVGLSVNEIREMLATGRMPRPAADAKERMQKVAALQRQRDALNEEIVRLTASIDSASQK